MSERIPVVVNTPTKTEELNKERATPSTVNATPTRPDNLIPQTEAQGKFRVGMTPEEKAKRKAKLINVLERGVIHDRLKVELPPDVHGEWCRNDPLEIARLETLGFQVETRFGQERALNSDGDGKLIVGDVIFMTTSRENKELIDEIRQDEFYRMNGKPGENSTKEEKEFADLNRIGTQGDIGTSIESKTAKVGSSGIEDTMRQINRQLTPSTRE